MISCPLVPKGPFRGTFNDKKARRADIARDNINNIVIIYNTSDIGPSGLLYSPADGLNIGGGYNFFKVRPYYLCVTSLDTINININKKSFNI